MKARPRIERRNGRIYFGKGEHEWSCWDPAYPISDARLTQRGSDWTWLVNVCPTTADALEKVRLIRWAVNNVAVNNVSVKGEL